MQYEGIKKTSYGKIRGHQEDKNVVFETREFLIHIITQYIYIFNIYIKQGVYVQKTHGILIWNSMFYSFNLFLLQCRNCNNGWSPLYTDEQL